MGALVELKQKKANDLNLHLLVFRYLLIRENVPPSANKLMQDVL